MEFIIDLSPRSLIKALEKAGFEFVRQSASHKMFYKEGHDLISVPCHGNRDLKIGIYRDLMKKAGLK